MAPSGAISVAMAGALVIAGFGAAVAQTCSRTDFESAVGDAAKALRELNLKNKPAFQAKLRQLKSKRGWNYDEFVAAAAPIVQDEKIASFDERSSAFLARIEQLGAVGASATSPDCRRLVEVQQSMKGLVDVQEAKWAYMFQRISKELER